jgi:hypothetical protein
MRFKEHYGVYVLDEGGFSAKKCAIRNVYGSEIGNIIKGAWREAGGTLVLNDVPEKFTFMISSKNSCIEILYSSSIKEEVRILDTKGEDNYMLALIVYSWMQSLSAVNVAAVY